MVTENLAPRGHGSPLHVHRNEDEWFYVMDDELTFWIGGASGPRWCGPSRRGQRGWT